MINEIQQLIKRNIKEFLSAFITKFYTKDEIDNIFFNKKALNKINENDEGKMTYNDSILYTEDDIINIKASNIIVDIDGCTKTLQDILSSILKAPTETKAYCGIAECGDCYCGDTDFDDAYDDETKAYCGIAECGNCYCEDTDFDNTDGNETKAYCGAAECGECYCGDIDSDDA